MADLKKSRRQKSAAVPRYGERFMPSAPEAERCIIGCILLDPVTCLPEVQLLVKDLEFFYDLRCRTAFEIINGIEPGGVDIVTVQQAMKDSGRMKKDIVIPFLSECQDAVPSAANLSAWLDDAQQKYILRRVLATAAMMTTDAYEVKDAEELLTRAERDVLAIRTQPKTSGDIKTLLQEATSLIEFKALHGDAITGLSTGIHDLDRKTDGLHKSEFIVVCAYPSCGKTALMVNIALHNALAGVPAAILSAEMRPVQLVLRSICSESRVNFRQMNEQDFPKLTSPMARISKSPLHCENINGFTIGQVEALARRMVQAHGIKLFVVDYLQLLTAEGDNESQRLTAVSHGLKRIAMEHNVPVMVGSQLNDDGKMLGSRTPSQDGDSVFKLVNKGEWQPHVQPVTLSIDKSRDGETGKVDLTFMKQYTRFEQASKNPVDDADVPGHTTTSVSQPMADA